MKFSKYVICLSLILIFSFSNIYADEIKTEDTNSSIETKLTEEEIQKQKGQLKSEVSNLTEQIRNTISEIDEKIVELRKTDEYNTYPTIRLNIDTPIFGMKSIINQKLRITKDVSAADVAKGYSIRYVVKNRVVKIPATKLGNIVVSTNEIDIDDQLDINEYNTVVLKLMNYKDKVNSVNDFLEDKTNKMFKEFISKEKKDRLNEFSSRLSEINKSLLDEDSSLTLIYLAQYDGYSDLSKEYLSLKEKKKELENKISNVLIETSKLNDIQKSIISLESDVIDYTTKVDKVIDENIDIKIENVYLNAYENLKSRYETIEQYIKNSEKEIVVESVEEASNTKNKNDDNKNTNNKNTDKNNDKSDSNNDEKESVVTTQIEKVYDVFSEKYFDTMKSQITTLEQKMDEFNITYKNEKESESSKKSEDNDKTNNENKDKNDSKIEEKYKTLTEEEIQSSIEEVINLYNEFLNNEYLFYLDNVNGTLNVTNSKLKNLAEYTSADVISHIQYIYIDLPTALEKYLDTYDINSTIEIKELISKFNGELNKLLKEYKAIVKLYEDFDVDDIISKT